MNNQIHISDVTYKSEVSYELYNGGATGNVPFHNMLSFLQTFFKNVFVFYCCPPPAVSVKIS